MDFERLARAGLVHRRPIDFNTVAGPGPDSMADAAITASAIRRNLADRQKTRRGGAVLAPLRQIFSC
jgi:hypothetical protein